MRESEMVHTKTWRLLKWRTSKRKALAGERERLQKTPEKPGLARLMIPSLESDLKMLDKEIARRKASSVAGSSVIGETRGGPGT